MNEWRCESRPATNFYMYARMEFEREIVEMI
jgi:hypothetical protein